MVQVVRGWGGGGLHVITVGLYRYRRESRAMCDVRLVLGSRKWEVKTKICEKMRIE